MRRDERSLFELARMLRKSERGAQLAQENSNDMKPTFGKIVDVDDPERRGRVKVILDNMNPDFLTENGFDQGDSKPTQTDWIKPDTPFRGIQPEKLVGMRVPVKARDGDPNRLSFGSPVFDPEETKDQQTEGEIPDNSDMVRCQVYPSGSLPDATKENHGCIVIEEDGPMDCDWMCVCIKRKGEFYWVRMIDLSHGHAGEDDGIQKPDTAGDGEDPVKEMTIWDYVFPTTHEEYDKNSKHGTSPRDNPFGGEAKWHGGA